MLSYSNKDHGYNNKNSMAGRVRFNTGVGAVAAANNNNNSSSSNSNSATNTIMTPRNNALVNSVNERSGMNISSLYVSPSSTMNNTTTVSHPSLEYGASPHTISQRIAPPVQLEGSSLPLTMMRMMTTINRSSTNKLGQGSTETTAAETDTFGHLCDVPFNETIDLHTKRMDVRR
uniref:Uncharacterized protein n=1 Tax=Lygus hesperus TaxID=30085 RepID=A0A0A9YJ37_LYGHE